MIMYYVVTEYWGNGEWENSASKEIPIAVYTSFTELTNDVKNGYTELEVAPSWADWAWQFKKIEDKKEFQCPYGYANNELQIDCEYECFGSIERYFDYMEYDDEKIGAPEVYYECKGEAYDWYDNSYIEYRVYNILG